MLRTLTSWGISRRGDLDGPDTNHVPPRGSVPLLQRAGQLNLCWTQCVHLSHRTCLRSAEAIHALRWTTLTKKESTGMPGGFLPLRQSALQPLVRAIREVGELVQGMQGPAPASQAYQVSMNTKHDTHYIHDC